MWWLAGCTFAPGSPFAEIDEAELVTAYAPAARDLGDGTATSDLGYVFAIERFEAELLGVEIQELQGATGGASFDPANPPPGYSLCHGGHCHADDGSLVSYGEIEVALAGGGASLVPVVRWDEARTLDLRERASLDLGPPSPADLPEVTLTRVVVFLGEIRLDGRIGGPDTEERPFALTVPALDLAADLGRDVDRNIAARLALSLEWTVDGTLFDGIDVAGIDASAPIEAALADAVLENLSTNLLAANLSEAP